MSASAGLCLFDLDDTLLPLDSDHAWGDFMVSQGWVDPVAFRRRNDEFYAQYKVGQLDIHAYIEFATAPLRARSLAKRINVPIAICDKRREKAGESEVMNVIGDVAGKRCVLIDDIVSTVVVTLARSLG